ncbi:hypothetical protein [Kitasatospora kifunensis]|uniref:Uncharacterized protein n=1 Tax=Kitasatospora kifunensis TaxID=58351 RepID=A0A7W7R4A2_KITKI|nr:hypothetical protein [Kitasatospora kifunensis]MBB4924596.1 hypothetical protein [Kitasatospora kifunensis]
MGSELDVVALAAEASNILVAEAVRSGWQSLREAVARFFHRDGTQSLNRQMALLDAAHEELESADPEVRALAQQALHERWMRQLPAYLELYPEAAEDLRDLLAATRAVDSEPDGAGTMNANFNTNSVVVQARGNVNAGGGINNGAPRSSS